MSNPLLKPNDPRFTKPSLIDAAGENVFAERTGNDVVAATAADESTTTPNDNIYGSSAASAPYQPRFEVSQGHRGMLLLVLAMTGLVGSFLGFASLSSLWVLGWVFSFLSVVPAACAIGLGWQDLRAMRLGAMNPKGHNLTLLAFWLGSLGAFCSLAMDAAVLYFVIFFGMTLV